MSFDRIDDLLADDREEFKAVTAAARGDKERWMPRVVSDEKVALGPVEEMWST